MKQRNYYTLLVWVEDLGRWSPEFGDYTKQVVNEERYLSEDSGIKCRIIKTDDHQSAIDEAVRVQNIKF